MKTVKILILFAMAILSIWVAILIGRITGTALFRFVESCNPNKKVKWYGGLVTVPSPGCEWRQFDVQVGLREDGVVVWRKKQ